MLWYNILYYSTIERAPQAARERLEALRAADDRVQGLINQSMSYLIYQLAYQCIT